MRQIIALGGGGFSMEPDNSLLDRYILKQTNKNKPKICFVPTASGDSDSYISKYYTFFTQQNCKPTHLSLFKPPTGDIRDYVLEKDIIYVGGGSTKNLLALWKEWGLDKILEEAWNQGTVLAGISAGSICWFDEGITDSYGFGLEPINCLGLLNGSNCPHYDGESERRPSYQQFIKTRQLKAGLAADDGVAIHFIDQDIHKIVSSRVSAKAYKVSLDNNKIEEELQTVFLGAC
ncbi:peptidase E [Virgibacillus ihumii]|uniref:Type 1 glutamine amidotransferase-like domain-containing protein n=1 Tax=Virgibacillus ihumii TaxID=2686091 RepID=UPI00157DC2BD|nr:peptidase E [Virgibacillus ihumii]